MTPLSRFDSLVHVTRDGRWTNGRHDASYDRLIAELDRGAVARACLVGLAGVVDNEYVLDCAAASGGRLVPIAGLDPTASTEVGKLPAVIRGLARAGFSGFKLHPRLNGFDPLDARALAAIRAAASEDLVVFLDTLFRQPSRASKHAADTIDAIAHACPTTTIVLLHGGGPAVLEVAEVVRVRPSLILDLSFTMLHYRGSSLDDDLRWLMERLDQRIVIGSDMPEFTPSEAFNRAAQLAAGLAPEKWANIACRNLEHLFPVPTAATNA
jgi:predicted TIM-barrel fold metal-dependent hydrolase